ncbi:MAG: ATP-binding protein [Pseudobdellovibrionaceae bacterium]
MKQIQRFFDSKIKTSFFLFGPRGVGKSRLLRQEFKKAVHIDLLNEKILLQYLSDPERLESLILPLKKGDVVIIDEVQRAPSLLSKVHEIMESDKFPRVQFILTGSSARKLKEKGVDLLAGRAVVKRLFPFMVSELGPQADFKQCLTFGLIPLVFASEDPQSTLDSYIGLYLKEEVKQEGLVRNLESFSRFLEVMCFSHAELINLSNVAREASIKRATVDGYMSILEDLLLGYRIPSFKIKNRKQTVSSEKFYYFDIGVFKSLCPQGLLDNPSQFLGQEIEGFVCQNLMAWISYRNKNEKLFFWRTTADTEVDFVIYGPKKFMAVEVKAAKEIKREFLVGLKSFGVDYPLAEKFFLYMGSESRTVDGIKCLPIEKFLKSLKHDSI